MWVSEFLSHVRDRGRGRERREGGTEEGRVQPDLSSPDTDRRLFSTAACPALPIPLSPDNPKGTHQCEAFFKLAERIP